jgi:SSS family solute:Na+ symporter
MNIEVAVMFPAVFVIALIGCFAGTLLTKPEEDEILIDFYRRVRPWGFWGPVLAKVRATDPNFQPNRDFYKDMFNVGVGMVWQIALVALPIYIVIKNFSRAGIAFTVVAVTSLILKVTWYDRLKQEEIEFEAAEKASVVAAPAVGD